MISNAHGMLNVYDDFIQVQQVIAWTWKSHSRAGIVVDEYESIWWLFGELRMNKREISKELRFSWDDIFIEHISQFFTTHPLHLTMIFHYYSVRINSLRLFFPSSTSSFWINTVMWVFSSDNKYSVYINFMNHKCDFRYTLYLFLLNCL